MRTLPVLFALLSMIELSEQQFSVTSHGGARVNWKG
jgi:hypothetical protein